MSYVRVESTVRLHPKFLKAGPAASWLWLCGLAHSQEALTDGFIAAEALPFLGVPNARKLASTLVDAHLWHECEGGWKVHDYLDHNNSAADIRRIADERVRIRSNNTHNSVQPWPSRSPSGERERLQRGLLSLEQKARSGSAPTNSRPCSLRDDRRTDSHEVEGAREV